jgi:uncharacterized membrane protein
VLSVLAFIHAVMMSALAHHRHQTFQTFAFDLGIYDQAVWLIGHGAGGFSTMRGLPIFGHHVNMVLYLLAPLSWLGLGTLPLIVVQAAALSAGALPVSWMARTKLQSSGAGLVFGVVYLLYPAISWLSWVSFHPESLAVPLVLFAMWFSLNSRWGWFAVCIVLALSTREEVGLLVALLGVCMMLTVTRDRVSRPPTRFVGLVTSLVGAGWFLICTKWIIPHHLQGESAFYVQYFFGSYGNSMGEVVTHLATNPQEVVRAASQPDAKTFLLDLLGPLGFFPLVGLPVAAISGPQVATTLLGNQSFLRQITNQYTALIIPGFFAASIDAVARIRRRAGSARPFIVKVSLVWLAFCSMGFAVLRGPLPGAVGSSEWQLYPKNIAAMDAAVALVPDGVSVTATNEIAPHLSHRKVIYMFPNPFERILYGLGNAKPTNDPPNADLVEEPLWVIANTLDLSPKRQAFIRNDLMRNGRWDTVFDRDGVIVLRPHVA